MRWLLTVICVFPLFVRATHAEQSSKSPREEMLIESRYGIILHDPFRWMENPNDPELVQWIETQNQKTEQYLAGNLLDQLKQELTDILLPPLLRSSAARQVMRSRMQERWQHHYRRYRPNLAEEMLLPQLSWSPSGRYQVEFVSDSSSDLLRLEIVDTQSGLRLRDVLMVKFPQVFWAEDEKSFLYVTDRDGRIGHVLSAVFHHELGTTQPYDTIIYEAEEHDVSINLFKTDTQWLIALGKGYGYSIGRFDVQTGEITPILPQAPGPIMPFMLEGDNLYLISFRDAPLGEIVTLNLGDGSLQRVMPEQDLAIDYACKIGESIFVTFVENAASKLVRFDQNTGEFQEIALPITGSAYGYDAGGSLGVYITSYSQDFSLWWYDEEQNQLVSVYQGDPLPFELESFRIYYRAHNGQHVPIWIVKRPEVNLSPETPVLLYGYGGFTINILPYLDLMDLPWYQRGGVSAFVTLPGGYEYGEDWHQAGMLHNKMNVFKDFAAAARHLIKNRYTSRKRLVANGASNGGLLVGAVVNLYPHLFRVAVPEVGVMDMGRYQLFTGGKWWVDEFGDRNNAGDYYNLIKISPYHNIRHRAYPSVLVMSADFDDRVVPSHSFKYAARLQARQRGNNPVLLHTKRWGSHYNRSGTLEEQVKYLALRWAFIMTELGMR